MSTSQLHEYWQGLHNKQSEWAFRAYGRLIMTLSQDVQEKLSLKDEAAQPYVVIFGKTQVGKTTLLLDLMGVAPEKMHVVSAVMRGGREHGKSATATAMEYCASDDGRWGLTLQAKTRWFESDHAMTQALGELREDMERGQLIAETPCIVHIPKNFFGQKNANAPSVRILDLPGDNPANEQEQKHVHQMAKTYLPFADLILLVGRGDDLGFLRPEVITLPGIEDWQAMPHRFRIITTYSYTAKSVRDLLRNNSNVDESVLRRRLIQEIERFGVMSEAARDEALYFPLEFGNSWMGVQAREPELYQRMSPIITRLRAQLIDQIVGSTTPIGRLRSTLNTHHSVRYIQKKKKESIESRIAEFEQKEEKISEEVAIWKKLTKRAGEKLCKIEKILELQDIKSNRCLVKDVARKIVDDLRFPLNSSGENRKALRDLVIDYREKINSMISGFDVPIKDAAARTYWLKVKNAIPSLDCGFFRDIWNDKFSSIGEKLDNYWFDTYIFSENFQRDRDLVHEAAREALKSLLSHRVDVWFAALKKVHGDYVNDLRNAKNDLMVKEFEYKKSCKQKDVIKKENSVLRAELECVEQKFSEDLRRCEKFDRLLDEEYLGELSKRMHDIHKSTDNCDALLQLFSCVDLKRHHEELMALSSQNIH